MPLIGENVVDKVKRSKSSLKQLVIPGMFFEEMGITYIGPVDGHNVTEMVSAFNDAMKLNEPVLVHVKTVKGKGYRLAEDNPSFFHGVDPFNKRTGELKKKNEPGVCSYTSVFGESLCRLAEKNDRIAAVCAAMPLGTGLNDFARLYPARFFDVGIAEEHAVTFAGALSAGGMIPVVAIYSTFLQRAYDQILHDVCVSRQHVVFAVDRGGLVGSDGRTHQGIYDLSYLSSIPELTVMCPKNKFELDSMLDFAVNEYDGPVAIRYPRGRAYEGLADYNADIEYGKSEIIHKGSRVLILALGSMTETGEEVYNRLLEEGITSTLVNMRFAKPFDKDIIDSSIDDHDIIVTMEENSVTGGVSERIAAYIQWTGNEKKTCIPVSLPDMFIEHGNVNQLKDKYAINTDSIIDKIRRAL